jgi:hypothetical protein
MVSVVRRILGQGELTEETLEHMPILVLSLPPLISEESESEEDDTSEKPEEDRELSASVIEAIARDEDGAFT